MALVDMKRVSAAMVGIPTALFLVVVADSQESRIRITSPSDGAGVESRPVVEGTVDRGVGEVWVIVRPMEGDAFWVQPRVSRTEGGWRVRVYLGRPGDIDRGKRFEIMAVADPDPSLRLGEGAVLRDWPRARWWSSVIEVTRR